MGIEDERSIEPHSQFSRIENEDTPAPGDKKLPTHAHVSRRCALALSLRFVPSRQVDLELPSELTSDSARIARLEWPVYSEA